MWQRFTSLFAHKISRDLAWTAGSFASLGLCGIAVNLVIVHYYDAAMLGVFNVTYAVYLIGSQLASCGVHSSILRHIAYHQQDRGLCGEILGSALLLTIASGVGAGLLLYMLAPFSAGLFGSPAIAEAIRVAAFGMVLFPLNKVLVHLLNAMQHMRAFALLQGMRYVIVLLVVVFVAMGQRDFRYAPLAFLGAELFTLVGGVFYLARGGWLPHLRVSRLWLSRHLRFGGKGMLGGIFVDLNTRLDVLLLGILLSERAVGIYSFAAMLIDGMHYILAFIRVNMNPMLVIALRDGATERAQRMLAMSRRWVTALTVLLGIGLFLGFTLLVELALPGKGLSEGSLSLAILIGGFVLFAGYAPFDQLLLVSGHPGYQTAQCAVVTVVNAVLCLSLSPWLGIEGAALATIGGYLSGMAFLMLLSPRLTGWNLLHNRFVR